MKCIISCKYFVKCHLQQDFLSHHGFLVGGAFADNKKAFDTPLFLQNQALALIEFTQCGICIACINFGDGDFVKCVIFAIDINHHGNGANG